MEDSGGLGAERRARLPDKKGTEIHTLRHLYSCGECAAWFPAGRNLTLEKAPAPEVLPLVVRKLAALKRPYVHYREGGRLMRCFEVL